MEGTILIIDDEAKLRSLLARLLKLEGYMVYEAGDLKTGTHLLATTAPDVILCDVKLPDGNGVDFVAELKQKSPVPEIILLTAYGNIPDGVQAMKNGAFDYITKGDDNNRILPLLSRVIEKVQLQKRLQQLEDRVRGKYHFENIIGNSPAIRAAVALARRVAPTEATVLLLGETGTGKEVFAQAIHHESSRNKKAFVALNCGAFARDILESELFGHKAGAFTGALKDKKGLLEEANGGTLFLDEIGEMAYELQSKLLRVLETGEFIKVGDTKPSKVAVRVIAATNRNLETEVANGHFREDLYYRLHVFTIHLPPLRERPEDIEALARQFVQTHAAKAKSLVRSVSKEALALLKAHPWKGNIRELQNVIARAVILEDSTVLSPEALPYDIQRGPEAVFPETLDLASAEKAHLQKVLRHTNGNKTETARLLQIGLTTLYRKMEEYGIPK